MLGFSTGLLLRSNARLQLAQDDFSIDVNSGDYLDILCPHYPPGTPESSPPETLVLYLVREEQFRGCVETEGAIKRWECNHPYAPLGPVRFTEKIQRFTPFSMGFEFLSGHHYYYSSLTSKAGPLLPCMKLKVTVCCNTRTPGQHIKGSAARTRLSLLLLILIPLFLHSSV
ncbi:hypothetical protein SKAU_G00140890 [Synaphobranchus kaupii]|uniref:Ephrin RBD domain-containing protein n=1 Tax=Synaphobranchus kaupii TaxID=118154 RepID=A0A9Q1FT92_SYNKA|nr:hypothetical protein SKAU_G00140890 [Synaphobranchus kaupii]